MRKTMFLTAIVLLTAAVAIAQATSPSSSSTDPNASASTPQTSSPTSQLPPDQNSSTQAVPPSDPNQTFLGCLNGADDKFTLTDQSGKTYQLQGDSSMLKSHVGQQVQVIGSMAGSTSASSNSTDTITVASLNKVGDTCSSSPATASPSVSSTGGTSGAMTTEQSPAVQPSETPSAGISSNAAAPSSTEAAAPSSTTSSGEVSEQSTTTSGKEKEGANLPQTASPLPLLSLLGLGSIGVGLLSRRKK